MTTVRISGNAGATFGGVTDNSIQQLVPTTVSNAGANIFIDCQSSGTARRMLLKFDGISNVVGPVTVGVAQLRLSQHTFPSAKTYHFYKLLVPFDTAYACWNNRTNGVAWTTPGALGSSDVDMTPVLSAAMTSQTFTLVSYTQAELVACVQDWINNPGNNHGLLIVKDSESEFEAVSRRFCSEEIGDTTNQPELYFEYTASGPTVSSVTQTSGGTEGSPAVMTVALSGATSGSTNFAATLVGVTATGSGTDFTSDLASATYSNGVTFSGGNMVVPDAVSGWTVTIATTGDTLDEANETATLTVGGTAGTLTITDDDAAPTITGTASSTVTAGSPVVITYSPGLSGQSRTYTLALTDGTAVGGTDYDNTTVTGDFAVTAGTGSVSISGSTVTVDPGVTEFTLSIGTTA